MPEPLRPGATTRATRVVCVDVQRTLLDALAVAVDGEGDLVCVGKATSLESAFELLESSPADVVLLDVDMPGIHAADATRALTSRFPNVRVVVLASVVDLEMLVNSARCGASAFLPKDSPLADVLAALRARGDHGITLGSSTTAALVGHIASGASAAVLNRRVDLTDREREVLTLLADGLDAKSIARELGIALHTCRGYVQTVLVKLGAHSQVEAVVLAARMGLVDLSPTA